MTFASDAQRKWFFANRESLNSGAKMERDVEFYEGNAFTEMAADAAADAAHEAQYSGNSERKMQRDVEFYEGNAFTAMTDDEIYEANRARNDARIYGD